MSQYNNAQVAEFNQTEAALADLRHRYGSVVFPVETGKGMEEAKKGRVELRTLRVGLEEMRVNLKAPLLERGRLIDAEAKRLTGEIVLLEEPIDTAIKKEEARREAVKLEKERIERERKDAVKAKIDEIRNLPLTVIGKSATEIGVILDDARSLTVDEGGFAEFTNEAKLVRDVVVSKLRHAHDAQVDAEAEQARLKAEREELARQKVEQEARAKAEREAQEAALRAQREEAARQEAALRAEREAQEAALRAQREAQEAELRAQREEAARQEAERNRLAEDERQKMAAERAALEAARLALEEAQKPAVPPAPPLVSTPVDIRPTTPHVDMRLPSAKRELMQFRAKYSGVKGLEGVMGAIDDLVGSDVEALAA